MESEEYNVVMIFMNSINAVHVVISLQIEIILMMMWTYYKHNKNLN